MVQTVQVVKGMHVEAFQMMRTQEIGWEQASIAVPARAARVWPSVGCS